MEREGPQRLLILHPLKHVNVTALGSHHACYTPYPSNSHHAHTYTHIHTYTHTLHTHTHTVSLS